MTDKITFNGHDIMHGNRIDYDMFKRMQRKRNRNLDRARADEIARMQSKRKGIAMREWESSIPAVYRGAGLEGMEYDRQVHDKMASLLDEWRDGARFNIVVSTPDPSTMAGKSWCAYSWLTGLVENGSILYPNNEIVFRTEGELMTQEYGKLARLESTFDDNPDMRILVIDEMFKSSLEKNVAYREEAWHTLIDRCRRSMNKIYLVMVINPPFTANGIMSRPNTTMDGSWNTRRPQSARRTVGDMYRERNGGNELNVDHKANELVDEILPLRSYLGKYPDDSKMTKGFILTVNNPLIESNASM